MADAEFPVRTRSDEVLPRLLAAVIAVACSACGGRVSYDASAHGSSDGAPSVTLAIPLGAYTGCTSSTVTVAPSIVGTAAGDGTITLSQAADGVVATLDFGVFVSGKVAFTPTSSTSAAFTTGQPYVLDALAFEGPSATTTKADLTSVTGSLVLVGDTLFISAQGKGADAAVSVHLHCPVPTSIAPTNVVTTAPPAAAVTAGVYGPCTSNFGAKSAGSMSGGSGSVTLGESSGKLAATWNDDVTPVCNSLDFAGASDAPALTAGQTCDVQNPCGPPPTLGQSPYPSDAALTNMLGSMTADANALFIDVVAETTPETCGRHFLSIICAPP